MKPFALLSCVALLLLSSSTAFAENYSKQRHRELIQECNKNKLESCVTAGIWTRDYLESPADAYQPLKKACDGGNMRGCNVLGNLYLNQYSGLGMEYDMAMKLYTRSCKGGYERACTNLKNIEAEIKQSGAPNKEKRLESLQRSCAMEDEAACRALMQEMHR